MPATKKAEFETIPVGTKVTWHYRSAIGHGTVKGVHEKGTNACGRRCERDEFWPVSKC